MSHRLLNLLTYRLHMQGTVSLSIQSMYLCKSSLHQCQLADMPLGPNSNLGSNFPLSTHHLHDLLCFLHQSVSSIGYCASSYPLFPGDTLFPSLRSLVPMPPASEARLDPAVPASLDLRQGQGTGILSSLW